jgi:hypothetical protein
MRIAFHVSGGWWIVFVCLSPSELAAAVRPGSRPSSASFGFVNMLIIKAMWDFEEEQDMADLRLRCKLCNDEYWRIVSMVIKQGEGNQGQDGLYIGPDLKLWTWLTVRLV